MDKLDTDRATNSEFHQNIDRQRTDWEKLL